jgi:acetylornithine deacetylase
MRVENSTKDRVLRKIEANRPETVKLLQQLVAARSITGNEAACADVCQTQLKKLGLKVDCWEPDENELRKHPAYNDVIKYPPLDYPLSYSNRPIVVGFSKGKSNGRSIILNGHMDVVSPEPVANWKHDPWGGEVDDDKLFGRGALDMKGGITTSMIALQSILECEVELKGDAIIECVIEEEVGVGNGTLASLLRGYRADACIVTEPSGLRLGRGMRGGLYFRITVQGKSFHGVEKWKGKDAIELGVKMFTELKSLEIYLSALHSHPLFQDVPISIPITPDKIHAGTWKGMVAPECTIEGYFETLPGKSNLEWEKLFRQCIAGIAKMDPWLSEHPPIVEFTEKYDPYEIPATDKFLQTMENSYLNVMGSKAEVIGMNGGCDATVRANYGHSSTVVFGPSGSNWHGIDEYVSVDSMIACEKVIAGAS